MNFITKLIFYLKKPKIVIVTGQGRKFAVEAIWQVFKPHFKAKKLIEKIPKILNIFKDEIFIVETDLKGAKLFKKLKNFIKFSQLPILVMTHIGEIPKDSDSFSGDEKDVGEIQALAEMIPPYGFLILNCDDRALRKIDDATNLKNFTFGFQEEADFKASDIHINTGTNFKINYKGKIIPIWQENLFGKEHIYSALAASCVGILFGLNFVEISESLKNYKGPEK